MIFLNIRSHVPPPKPPSLMSEEKLTTIIPASELNRLRELALAKSLETELRDLRRRIAREVAHFANRVTGNLDYDRVYLLDSTPPAVIDIVREELNAAGYATSVQLDMSCEGLYLYYAKPGTDLEAIMDEQRRAWWSRKPWYARWWLIATFGGM